MLNALGLWARDIIARGSPFTNVLGLARTLIALSTLSTLVFSDSAALFVDEGTGERVACTGAAGAGLFCLVDVTQLEWMRLVAIAGLLLVASGYRPRFSGTLHAYITVSVLHNAALIDGGDQLAANFSLLLLPVTLLDARRFHWQAPPAPISTHGALLAHALLFALRVQVAALYFHAGVSKLAVPEWSNGTVLYYWMRDPAFGAPAWLVPVVDAVVGTGALVALLTWGVLALEMGLAAAIVMPRERARYLLPLGIALHLGIALVHGLISFSLVMFAALLLYLWPLTRTLEVPRSWRRLASLALPARHDAVGKTHISVFDRIPAGRRVARWRHGGRAGGAS